MTKTLPLVHISKMSGKLDGLRAISTNTVTNSFCIKMNAVDDKKKICTHCYSHTMLKSYRKNMAPALQRNSDLLSSRRLLKEELPVILDAFFRFSAHGELINDLHFKNLLDIVNRNTHCRFALWTKRKDIVSRVLNSSMDKPENLNLIYSNPTISNVMKKVPKHFDKTFNNVLEDEHVEMQNCTGQQCKNCLICYTKNDTDTIVEKVKRY
jgi:hypothetical protein